MRAIQINEGENSPNLPISLPLAACRPHLIHQCVGRPHSPLQTTARSVHALHTTMQQSPHCLQWDAPNSPPKLSLSLRRSPPPSNTPSPRLTLLTIPNSIFIQSAVLPQCAFRTDRRPIQRPTDGLGDRSTVYTISANARYIDRERHVYKKPS